MLCSSFFNYLFGAFRLLAFVGDGGMLYSFYTNEYRGTPRDPNISSDYCKDLGERSEDEFNRILLDFQFLLYGFTAAIGVYFFMYPALVVLAKRSKYSPDPISDTESVQLLDDDEVTSFAQSEEGAKRFLRYLVPLSYIALSDVPVIAMVTSLLMKSVDPSEGISAAFYIGAYCGHLIATIGSVTMILFHELSYRHHIDLFRLEASKLSLPTPHKRSFTSRNASSHNFAYFILWLLGSFLCLCIATMFLFAPALTLIYSKSLSVPKLVSYLTYAGWGAWAILVILTIVFLWAIAFCR